MLDTHGLDGRDFVYPIDADSDGDGELPGLEFQPLAEDEQSDLEHCAHCGCVVGHDDQAVDFSSGDGPWVVCADCLDLEGW